MEPALSPVGSGLEPAAQRPLQLSRSAAGAGRRNSRCGTTARAGCSPIRARCRAGDILTVKIEINDRAKLQEQNPSAAAPPARTLGAGVTFEWDGTGSSGQRRRRHRAPAPTPRRRRDEALGKHRAVGRRRRHRSAAQRQSDDPGLAGSARQRRARILTIAGIVRPSDIGAREHHLLRAHRRGAHLLWRPRPPDRGPAAALRPAGPRSASCLSRAGRWRKPSHGERRTGRRRRKDLRWSSRSPCCWR